MTQNICKNCGNHFTGKFCNNCGEKVYTDHDKSFGHFLHETFHFFTHFDNKFFKTLGLIFKSPGILSLSYCNGVRDKYYKPVSLFFVGIVLYLLFPSLPAGLNMSFKQNLINFHAQKMDFMTDLANHKAMLKHISLDEVAHKYDHKSPSFAKILLLIILPLTGLALKIIFPKRDRYFFDYMILGTEASCVVLYLNFLLLPVVALIVGYSLEFVGFKSFGNVGDLFLMPVSAFIIIFWAVKAFKNFFGISYARAFGKGLLFLFLQSVIIFIIYRLILFLTVLAFI
ncbi:MAG: DUF3667 domain-containing protein [Ferruginibacter sp.]